MRPGLQRTVVDAGLTVFSLGYAVLVQARVVDATPLTEMGIFEVGAAGFAFSCLWWLRRPNPEAFAVVAVLSAFLCDVTGALPPIALATIALQGSWRRTVTATAAIAAIVLLHVWWEPGDSPLRAAAGTVIILVAVAGWATATHHRREVVSLLRQQVERSEREAELRAEKARQDERSRIARDMHDTLAHRMSLLAIQGSALAQDVDRAPDEVREVATMMRTTARESLEDLRWVMGALQQPSGAGEPLRPTPGPADLAHLVDQARRLGSAVELEVWPDRAALDSLPVPVGHVLFRVVQESLTNSRKHGAGRPVRVEVLAHPRERVEVTVAECGSPRGMAPVSRLPGAGHGLIGLAERVRTVGGNFSHGARVDGYQVSAVLPWTPAAGGA